LATELRRAGATHVFQDNKEGVTVLAVYVLLPALRFHCTRPHEPTATITMDNLKKIGGILDLVWAGDYMRAHKKLDEGEIRALPPLIGAAPDVRRSPYPLADLGSQRSGIRSAMLRALTKQ
jgi:hypothetical protein